MIGRRRILELAALLPLYRQSGRGRALATVIQPPMLSAQERFEAGLAAACRSLAAGCAPVFEAAGEGFAGSGDAGTVGALRLSQPRGDVSGVDDAGRVQGIDDRQQAACQRDQVIG